MLAARGRKRLRGATEPELVAGVEDRRAVDEFFAAAAAGDLPRVLAVLAPDLRAAHCFAGGEPTVLGREQFAGRATFGASFGSAVRAVIVDGAPGAIVTIDGRPVTAMKFEVHDAVITRIWSVTAPERLAQLVPTWLA